MAGGMGLLAMCDLAVAARHASFGLPEAKVGVFPMQVLALLQSQVPQRFLTQLCLTGDPVDAQRAREIGLVNEVADDLDAALERLLARVTGNSPTALRRGLYAMKAMRAMAFEEAIAFANSTRYGLSATVWTSDLKRAHRVAAALDAGTIWINCWLLRDLRVPFGGMKDSGVGREGGFESLNFFTESKNVCVKL
jgi:enoyl-CoA hydratase/carnithine racemase